MPADVAAALETSWLKVSWTRLPGFWKIVVLSRSGPSLLKTIRLRSVSSRTKPLSVTVPPTVAPLSRLIALNCGKLLLKVMLYSTSAP